jgi:hypothetical protein
VARPGLFQTFDVNGVELQLATTCCFQLKKLVPEHMQSSDIVWLGALGLSFGSHVECMFNSTDTR